MGIYLYNNDQIQRIERACLITAEVLDAIEEIVAEGVSTYDIDALAREKIRKSNGKPAFLGYKGYPAATCTSLNEVVVHGIPDKKTKLKKGDIVGIDIGVFYDGFFGDSARTYPVPPVNGDVYRLIEVTKESLYKGIEKCVAGNRISDISSAVEQHVRMSGFSPVKEFVGHGIGLNLHEEPSIPNFGSPGKGPRIKDGMVFAIEPMINSGTYRVEVLEDEWTVVTQDGSLSAHFEHTIAVVNGKAKILTRGKQFN